VGDPILAGNLTRRVDFALFMAAALENDELIHEAPAIVGCRTPSAPAHAADAGLSTATDGCRRPVRPRPSDDRGRSLVMPAAAAARDSPGTPGLGKAVGWRTCARAACFHVRTAAAFRLRGIAPAAPAGHPFGSRKLRPLTGCPAGLVVRPWGLGAGGWHLSP